ncbi:12330_t:CDS:2 [Cetraspora pellucida]|uniref:SURF1-like protein n=1 Tax=Cetraspora pellucida TaxID=1433469 RepID=A0A9N9F583_9GLOM|nr:12330_t:CDS:2 [Cetraspora pellucida]
MFLRNGKTINHFTPINFTGGQFRFGSIISHQLFSQLAKRNYTTNALIKVSNINANKYSKSNSNTKQFAHKIFLALFPIAGLCLGTWQIQRLRWKVGLIEEYEERLSKPQMILPKRIKLEVLNDYFYRRVKTSGKFLHDQEMLLGPRTLDNKHGYFVITPLERENGTTVLVRRGWISKDKVDSSTRKDNQFEGIVNIEGILKKSEKKNWFTPKNNPNRNEWLWIDVETMAERTGAQPVLVEQSLEGSPYLINKMIDDGIPVGKIPNVDLRNTHLQYAITWYSLSVATSIMLYTLVRKPPAGHFKRKIMQG